MARRLGSALVDGRRVLLGGPGDVRPRAGLRLRLGLGMLAVVRWGRRVPVVDAMNDRHASACDRRGYNDDGCGLFQTAVFEQTCQPAEQARRGPQPPPPP